MATDDVTSPEGEKRTFADFIDDVRERLRVLGGGKGTSRILIGTLVLLVAILGLAVIYVYVAKPAGDRVGITQLEHYGDHQQVISATALLEDAVFSGTYCTQPLKNGRCDGGTVRPYRTDYDRSATAQNLQDNLSKNVFVNVDHQDGKAAIRFIMTFILPLMILANLFGLIFMSKSGSGGISDIVGFGGIGRRRRKLLLAGTGVTFKDVAGADEAVTELKEVVDYLKDPTKYQSMAAQPPKGVLLLGPPGCGKTLLARAVAGESSVPFFSMSGAEFVESLVGVGAARVRDLFKQAQELAPAIIFIDELDAAARKRNLGGGSGGTDEREQTLNQMLVAMDGFEVSSGVVVMGATNRPDILDPALLRPGRFDRHVTVDEPDLTGRIAILGLHARKKPIEPDVDIEFLAHRTPGFTGADLANVVNEGALLAIRGGQSRVSMRHFTEAIQRVINGPQRRGHLMSDEERRRVAVHEAGHAVVAAALGHGDLVHRVSIVARGRGLGQSQLSNDADRVLLTRTELIDQMVITVAGGAAENMYFSDPSTTSEKDIEKVTEQAKQLIGRYGMSNVLGPIRYIGSDLDLFLGGETSSIANVSPATMQEFDSEVRKTVEYAYTRAGEVLEKHRADLERLSRALVEEETLEGPPLERLIGPVLPDGHATGPSKSAGGNGAAARTPRARRRPTAAPAG